MAAKPFAAVSMAAAPVSAYEALKSSRSCLFRAWGCLSFDGSGVPLFAGNCALDWTTARASAATQNKSISTSDRLRRGNRAEEGNAATSVYSALINTTAFYFGAGEGMFSPVNVSRRFCSPLASSPRSAFPPMTCNAWLMETSASGYFFWWSWASARWYQR